jgi:hypothetical protein
VVWVRFNITVSDKTKQVSLKCLLDSGASNSLIEQKFVTNIHQQLTKGKHTTWTSPAGDMATTSRCRGRFSLPELHRDRVIEWNLHVTKTLGAYDMILGRHFLSGMGMKFDFADSTIEWDNVASPMKDAAKPLNESYHIQEPEAIVKATDN